MEWEVREKKITRKSRPELRSPYYHLGECGSGLSVYCLHVTRETASAPAASLPVNDTDYIILLMFALSVCSPDYLVRSRRRNMRRDARRQHKKEEKEEEENVHLSARAWGGEKEEDATANLFECIIESASVIAVIDETMGSPRLLQHSISVNTWSNSEFYFRHLDAEGTVQQCLRWDSCPFENSNRSDDTEEEEEQQ